MTFPIDKLCFFDFETRSALDLPKIGTYAYAQDADAIILTYAIGDGPVRLVQRAGQALAWGDLPEDFRAVIDDPGRMLVAWNAGFDRATFNYSLLDSPFLAPRRVLDAMAQAMASNLPPALDMASTALGGPGKQDDGKSLITLFCATKPRLPRMMGLPKGGISGIADPKDFPFLWDRFCTYAARDTAVLRDVWRHTRALPLREWRVYWASEAICERGIGVDLDFCRAADRLAEAASEDAGWQLTDLTGGELISINQHVRLAEWVFNRLEPGPGRFDRLQEARDIMTTAVIEPDDRDENDDALPALTKISIARGNVERLLDWMAATKYDDATLKAVLELREFGASAAPKKFAAALAQHCGGRLRGQIVFNGAAQTGRFSGKGVQPQNLTRTPLGGDYGDHEPGAVDLIADGCSLDTLAAYGDGEAPSRKLALLVRPAIVAAPGRTLIKADYSQIEARGLPWLAASPAAAKLLAYFRAVDADPSLPDLYIISAAGMLKKDPQRIDKAERQRGKVATLACGYAGGKGALMSMAANYRMFISPEEAQQIVDEWRAANPWAPAFWGRHNQNESYGLMGAAMRAYQKPKQPQTAGRIGFCFEPSYLGGTLFMQLPSGRLLTYPWCKWREYEVKDKKTRKVIEVRNGLTFRRPDGMRAIYGGLLAENATQATCADLLREALVVLEEGLLGRHLDVVLHSHDEIVVECDEHDEAIAQSLTALERAMTFDRAWAKGLPLAVESTVRWYYSSAKQREAA